MESIVSTAISSINSILSFNKFPQFSLIFVPGWKRVPITASPNNKKLDKPDKNKGYEALISNPISIPFFLTNVFIVISGKSRTQLLAPQNFHYRSTSGSSFALFPPESMNERRYETKQEGEKKKGKERKERERESKNLSVERISRTISFNADEAASRRAFTSKLSKSGHCSPWKLL